MECIILAGGLGTRLQGVIGAYPKCMAPVNGKPFLYYLFEYLDAQNCKHAILSLGYKHEAVIEWLENNTFLFPISYVIENEPLGTGGGIQLAMQKANNEEVVIINGDTMFMVQTAELISFHNSCNATATLALKEMQDFDRYGVVRTNENGLITAFEEKQYRDNGTINGGVYVVNKNEFLTKGLPLKFSFEKDYLEQYTNENKFYGLIADAYFIDIGIPQDYERVQEDLKTMTFR